MGILLISINDFDRFELIKFLGNIFLTKFYSRVKEFLREIKGDTAIHYFITGRSILVILVLVLRKLFILDCIILRLAVSIP